MELLALRDSLDILGSKWKLPILQFLYNRAEETNNFTKIENGVQGISAKMLAKELKSLEVNLLVDRRQLPTRPVTVVYSINAHGRTTLPVIRQLVDWGKAHRQNIAGRSEILG